MLMPERLVVFKRLSYSILVAVAILATVGLLLSAGSDSDKNNSTNTAVAAALRAARSGACGAALKDGSILITGGHGTNGVLNSAEIFNARNGSRDAAPMNNARQNHVCAALADGRVLVAGGSTTGGAAINSAEIFNPSTGVWTPAGAMISPRSGATAVTLPNGRVLIAGGDSNGGASSSLELFNSATNSFQPVAGNLSSPKTGHAAVVLKNGKVLIAGGSSTVAGASATYKDALDSIDIYDPDAGTVSQFGKRLLNPRAGLSATVLLDGRVFFAGGTNGKQELSSAEIYDPKTGAITPAASMGASRKNHLAVLVPNNNSVLITGGDVQGSVVLANELYIPWWNKYKAFGSTGPQAKMGSFSAAVSGPAAATATDTADTPVLPTLFTDQPDYVPGQTALITGSGWTPNTEVDFVLTRDPDLDGLNPTTWSATADGNGDISTTYLVQQGDLNTTLTLTASSGSGDTAQIQSVIFTDASPKNTSLGVSTASGTYGGSTGLITATLLTQGQNNPVAGKTITFTLNGSPVGSATTDSNGNATLTSASLVTPSVIGAGSYPQGVVASFSGDSGFNSSSGHASLTVLPKTLTVSGITAANKTYDRAVTATLNTSGASLAGVLSGDSVTLNTVGAVGSFSDANAGSSKTVSVSGMSLSGGSASNYQLGSPQATASASIAPKPLTVTGLSANNKVYDATTSATITGTAALLSSEPGGSGTSSDGKPYNGDSVSLTGSAAGTFASKDASNGVSVTIAGLSLSGAAAGNYTLTAPVSSANITPKSLTTSGLAVNSKVYDATTDATLSGSAALQAAEAPGSGTTSDGKPYSGDAISITGAPSGAFTSKDVGSPVTVNIVGLAITGAQAADYTLASLALSGNITPKTLTVTGLAASNKVYDATTTATLTGSAVLKNAEAPGAGNANDGKPYTGDTVALSGTAAGTFASKDAANGIQVTVSGNALTGAQAGDYTLASNEQSGLSADIAPKTLTVTGLSANSKTYDATAAATLSGTASLLPAEAVGAGTAGDGKPYTGDAVSLGGTAVGAFASKDVASGIAVTVGGNTLTGAQSGDYVLASNEQSGLSANITSKMLTVIGLSANDKIYDATATAVLTGTAALQTAEVAGTGSGSDGKPYSGDSVSLTGTPAGAFTSKDAAAAVTVNVSGLSLSGGQAADYSLSAPVLSGNITPKALTATGLSATNKTYDGTTAAVLSGTAALKPAETPGSGSAVDGAPFSGDSVTLTGTPSGAFATKDAGTGITVNISGLSLSGAQMADYTLASATATANITPKGLTVIGLTANNKVYDGSTAATLSGTASLQGAEAAGSGTASDGKPFTGDSIALTGTPSGTFATANVGVGITVSVTGLSLSGAQIADYSLTPLTLSADITKATPVITWNNPADITYPTALSATQLNAVASVPGSLIYLPAAGAVLTVGNNQNLHVDFTPTDAVNYNSASKDVSINVLKGTPVITWSNPADITYPAALSATQLNATANVSGAFTYSPAAGAVLNAGPSQTLHVNFTPTDTANYNTASKDVTINVLKGTPSITWNNPADITYPTALSATQLNATAGVPGAFTYSPAAGTVLNAGSNQILHVDFTPSDTVNYNTAGKDVKINVLKATPVITWSNPADITYGTALSATQLNATADVAGTFSYLPIAGTMLNAGSQTLHVDFTPTDTVNYTTAGKDVVVKILKANQSITWSNPADITYGTALGAVQLNATVTVPGPDPAAGALTYTPPPGTILNAGSSQTLSVTAAETANYNSATKTVSINVSKANQTITWSNPADITYGTPLGAAQLNASVTVSGPDMTTGALTYTPAAGTILSAGSNQLSVKAAATPNYNSVTSTASINVLKATPVITWSNPADIVYGTALSATQLNASSPVAGAFVYTPPAGTVLNVGAGQTLSVTFTPTDTTDYNSAAKSVAINVNKRPATLTLTGTTSAGYGICGAASYTAVLRDSLTGNPLIGQTVSFAIGTQTAIATTDPTGAASVLLTLLQNAGSISASAAFAGTDTQAPAASNVLPVSIYPSASIGPIPGNAIYTGPVMVWTASPTSNTATMTLSATIKDTAGCSGDIRTAKVTFGVRNADGSYSALPSAQNLSVGLVSPTDPTTGTASAIVQYNLGNQTIQQMEIAVILGGNYTRNNTADDQLVTIAVPGVANRMVGGGKVDLTASPAAAGYLVTAPEAGADGLLDVQANVSYNKSYTNPQGSVVLKFNSYSKPNGSVDSVLHTYLIKSTSVASLTSPSPGVLSFTAKCVIQDVTNPAAVISVDGGATMQVLTVNSSTTYPMKAGPLYPSGGISIQVQPKAGGLWIAAGWNGTQPQIKPLVSGSIVGQ